MSMSVSMHTSRGKLQFAFKEYVGEHTGLYPALTIHCDGEQGGTDRDTITIFPSYEQVKQIHEELGKFIQTFEPEEKQNEQDNKTTV